MRRALSYFVIVVTNWVKNRPAILRMNGLEMKDFPSEEKAFEAAQLLMDQNKNEYDHKGGCEEMVGMPLLNKYYYIQGHGKKRTWSQAETKILEGERDVKSKKELADRHEFMEALGGSPSKNGGGIKDENATHTRMMKSCDSLKHLLIV